LGEDEQIWLPKSEETKVKERAKKHPADDMNTRPIPQRRQLEMRNPAKQKKTKQNTTHKSHHSLERLGED